MQERKDWLGQAALRRLTAQELRDLRLQQLRSFFAPASALPLVDQAGPRAAE